MLVGGISSFWFKIDRLCEFALDDIDEAEDLISPATTVLPPKHRLRFARNVFSESLNLALWSSPKVASRGAEYFE